MEPTALADTLKTALAHHQTGDLIKAGELYNKVLNQNPDHADALQLMGTMKYQLGELPVAKEFLQRAIDQQPNLTEAHHNLGNVFTGLGDFPAALSSYNSALKLNPDSFQALTNKGNVFRVQEKYADARSAYEKALSIEPNYASAQNGLGIVFAAENNFIAAISAHKKALEINPELPAAHADLARAYFNAGQFEDTLINYYHALSIDPTAADVHFGIGNLFFQQGRYKDAIRAYQCALSLNPENTQMLTNLGNAYSAAGDIKAAEICYQKTLKQDEKDVKALSNRANNLQLSGNLNEAEEQLRQALQSAPSDIEVLNNLGKLLVQRFRPGEGIEILKRALAINPKMVPALYNYGYGLNQFGLNTESIETLREVVALQPDSHLINSTLLLYLSYEPDLSAEELLAEHKTWAQRHAAPLASRIQPHRNKVDSTRKLRVGYVSMDLGRHPVGYMSHSVLTQHDSDQFEVYYYSGRAVEDDITKLYRSKATQWRKTLGISDTDLAQMIRDDEIDILIDLAGHTAGGRLPVFAEKPAPVQVTWIGYCDTTGLDTIDYILMDDATAPASTEELFSEKVVRLPDTRFCYSPPEYAPQVSPLPALLNGHVTFGSLSNLLKVTEDVLQAWADLLKRVSNSRLLIVWNTLQESERRERILDIFRRNDIDPLRIEFRFKAQTHESILREYNDIDIGLDTFPYSGGITTSEAMWMGVPVVTLRGCRAVSRQSASIIAAAGYHDLIADSVAEYLDIAANLSTDFGRLYEIRKNQRSRISKSKFCDAPLFVNNLENAYRTMWQTWCEHSS